MSDPRAVLPKRLHHIKVELHRTAKKAKAFQIQKLIKKLKTARFKISSNDESVPQDIQDARKKELSKLESQMAIIKSIHSDAWLVHAFIQATEKLGPPLDQETLNLVKEHIQISQSSTSDSSTPPHESVPATLLDSKEVKEAIQSGITDIQKTLGLPVTVPVTTSSKNKKRKQLEQTAPDSSLIKKLKAVSAAVKEPAFVDENEENSEIDAGSEQQYGLELDLDEDDLPAPPKLDKVAVASKKSTGISAEVKPKQKDEQHTIAPVASRFVDRLVADNDDDDDIDEDNESNSPYDGRVDYSDISMSDYDEDEVDLESPQEDLKPSNAKSKKKEPKKIKNRMGQRARRLLAAKMFGKNAKHLQPGFIKKQHQLQQQQATQFKPKPQEPTEKLHPSWQAKQAQKPTIAAFRGSKISFDDEGPTKPSKKSSVKEDPNLHPSWLAKKKQRDLLAQGGSGQKMVFNDD